MRAKSLLSLLALLPTCALLAADKTALLIANSDYGEHPLPEAKANVGKLAKVLEEAGKRFGAEVHLDGFIRFEIGEGVEKKEDDFAAEVAKLAG